MISCARGDQLNMQATLILNSYAHWLGEPLPDVSSNASSDTSSVSTAPVTAFRKLFLAPLVVLSHGTEEDPILNFGSKQALQLWERSWADFTRLPSRLTAEPDEREVRAAFMAEVARQGYSKGYTGVRISASGRRFRIEQAVVWNLIDAEGAYRGQAAAFSHWHYLD